MVVRRVLGIIVGIVIAALVIFCVELVGSRLFPAAAAAATSGRLDGVPLGALALVVVGWAVGTALGSLAAVRLARVGWAAWAVAGFVIAGVVSNAAMFPHPVWMVAGGILLPLLAAWIVSRSAPRPAGTSVEA